MTKIEVYPGDKGGCGFYRLIGPAKALQQQGYPVRVRPGGAPAFRRPDGSIMEVRTDADAVVMQRLGHPLAPDLIRVLKDQGIRVVMDIDDALFCIHPDSSAFAAWSPSHPTLTSWRITDECADLVDLVTVTTPELAEHYGEHGRVAVLPNRIQESWLSIPHPDNNEPVVGWTGTVATHPHDLEATGGGVAKALEDHPVPFHVVGHGQLVAKQLGVDRVVDCGWMDFDTYPHAVARLDVLIVPLTGSRFNRCKSGLKMLEGAACGVVPIGSPTPDNRRVSEDGIGLIADRSHEWEQIIRRLITDDAYRKKVTGESRCAVERHTIENNAIDWWEAWTG